MWSWGFAGTQVLKELRFPAIESHVQSEALSPPSQLLVGY